MAEFDRLPRDERALWIARWERDQKTCRDCGRPFAECSDPKRDHYPLRAVCYATMNREAAVAMYGMLHEKQPFHDGTFQNWSEKRSSTHPYHFTDGVKIVVADSDLAPHDTFTTDANASPERPSQDEG